MRNKKYAWIGLSLVGLVAVLAACGVGVPPKEPIELTILHTGQVIGEILPCG